jgi:N-methylhydantoinase B
MITERRRISPYGLEGGLPGKMGKNFLIRRKKITKIAPKASFEVRKGDSIKIETPGGGGWGKPR